jgi:uncharacterized membrane protein YfcA
MSNDTVVIVSVLVLGFIAGILSGMFGIGGGLVIVPALVILFQLPIKTATGTSLFALLWPVGLLGVIEYWRGGQISLRHGALIAVGLFLGAYFGAKLTLALSPSAVRRAYAIFLLVVGVYFLATTRTEQPAKPPMPNPAPSEDWPGNP